MTDYREIPDDKILEFSATPGFKGWKQFFIDESITHPAKMNLNLLRWILETYTEPGEVILDPMAGTGSTIILAALMGRHGIAVEYEPRFCDMISANIELTKRQMTLTPKGQMICIQGDARELSKLIQESEIIVTSPPYSSQKRHGTFDLDKEVSAMETDTRPDTKHRHTPGRIRGIATLKSGYSADPRNIGNLPHGDIDVVITSPPYSKSETETGGDKGSRGGDSKLRVKKDYAEVSNENIGNLPHGDIDSIITSPPFGPSTKGGGIFKAGYKAPGEEEVSDPGLPQRHARPLSDDPRNIDNLEYGESVDAVITSPPYEGSVPAYDEKWLEEHWDDESESPAHKTMRFGRSMKGYPKEVDKVITSPPYEQSLSHRGQDYEEVRKKLLAQGYSEEYIKASWNQPNQCQHWAEEAYGDDSGNIGNLKSETYLEAMIQVYRECWKVLKQSGKLILVTKNFIRDKQVVRLDLDTIQLCEAAGFRLADRWYFKLPQKSFWRILYKKRFPHVPEIDYEDIMIFSKEEDIVNKKDR
ncbi:hypothetical protein KKE60_04265 [Patescibacteria group bacterium]|nr:hypothetical protein [Patescibacteria group bacterium]